MAIFEGPAPTGEELSGPPPAASPAPSQGLPEVPPLTPERSRQELEKLASIITSNETLNFLEPRVKRCMQNGGADLSMLLSFYRLISQALAEELSGQRERLQASQSALAQVKQSSAQAQMQAALEEASMAVQMVQRGESGNSGGAGTPAGAPASDEVLAKLEAAEKQSERLLQDMQNMRNRAKIDVEVKVFKELEKFCGSLIPALDGFYQAMPTLKTTSDIASVVTGVSMIYETLQDSLEKAGLKRMVVVGQKFDPRFHEAIGEVPTHDMPDDHCFDELQPGYMLGERMIRAAMVRIARNDGAAPPAAAPAAAEETSQAGAPSPAAGEAPASPVPPAPPSPPAVADAPQSAPPVTPTAETAPAPAPPMESAAPPQQAPPVNPGEEASSAPATAPPPPAPQSAPPVTPTAETAPPPTPAPPEAATGGPPQPAAQDPFAPSPADPFPPPPPG